MISYRLLFDFSMNITGEAADDIDLHMMSAFIISSKYTFSTLRSAENIKYSFLNEGCCLSFKSMTWLCEPLTDRDCFSVI